MIKFFKTDERCVIKNFIEELPYPNIPIFFDLNGIIIPVSEFLVYKSINDTDASSSVETYAYILQKFLKYIEGEKGCEKVMWNKVTDSHLFEWRDGMEKNDYSTNYIIDCLSVVFSFYKWAEINKHLKNHVAIYDDSDREYAISAVKNTKKNSWVWPYYPSSTKKFKNTPTNDELEKIHHIALGMSNTVGVRDTLLMSIYERSARRFEALQITIDDIPSWDNIEEALLEDKIFKIKITGKGKVVRDIEFLPETMQLAREYIDRERQKIVDSVKKRNPEFIEPRDLFIGNNSGTPLNKQYISRRISTIMKKAGVDASGHRIRAKGLTDIVYGYDGYDANGKPYSSDDVLIRAAEKAGHKDKSSLRDYLALSRSSGADSKIANIERLRAIDNQLEQKKGSLSKIEDLKPLYSAYEEGNVNEIENELVKLRENLSDI